MIPDGMGHGDGLVLADANFPRILRQKHRFRKVGATAKAEGALPGNARRDTDDDAPGFTPGSIPVTGMAAPAELGDQPIHREY